MIQMMKSLIDNGYAYPSSGGVYFDVSKDADYGKLCHRDPEQMEAGSPRRDQRPQTQPRRLRRRGKGPNRANQRGTASVGSRPAEGCSASECSAMSMKYLGKTLDIHGGGLDLQFPHHENELAQSGIVYESDVCPLLDAQRASQDKNG